MKNNNHFIGEIIGNNKILSKDVEKTNQTKKGYWICECMLCHKIRSVRSDNLNKTCRSCSVKAREHKIQDDLTNKQFYAWKVLYKSSKPNYWHCRCLLCGTERDVFRGNLTQGISKSCGCVASWGEKQIQYFLEKNNIDFIKQYSFNDLVSDKNRKLHFDFAIFYENKLFCLIEYDGRQHYFYDENWKTSKKDFERIQKLDQMKNEYCAKKKILLYRITEKDDIILKLQDILFNTTGGNR